MRMTFVGVRDSQKVSIRSVVLLVNTLEECYLYATETRSRAPTQTHPHGAPPFGFSLALIVVVVVVVSGGCVGGG